VRDDLSPNPLRDLGDEGISEGSKTAHPSGNPISHSTHAGFSDPPAFVGALSDAGHDLKWPLGLGVAAHSLE